MRKKRSLGIQEMIRPAQTSFCNSSSAQVFPNTKQLQKTRSSVRGNTPKSRRIPCVFKDKSYEGLEPAWSVFLFLAQMLLGLRQRKAGISGTGRQTSLQVDEISAHLKIWRRCLKVMARAFYVFIYLFLLSICLPFKLCCGKPAQM